MKIWKSGQWVGAACLVALCGLGCNDDLYGPCDLDPQSLDPKQAECAKAGSGQKTCAIESFLQCDSRICARYNGSPGFCSQSCQSDADCDGDGQCKDFNIFSNPVKKYCVKNDLL